MVLLSLEEIFLIVNALVTVKHIDNIAPFQVFSAKLCRNVTSLFPLC